MQTQIEIRTEARRQIEQDKLTKDYIGIDLDAKKLEIVLCRRERCGRSYRVVCDHYPNFWIQGDIKEHGIEVMRNGDGGWMIAVW